VPLSDLLRLPRQVASRIASVRAGVTQVASSVTPAAAGDDGGSDDVLLPAVVSGRITLNLPALRRWPAAARLLSVRVLVAVAGEDDADD